MFKVQNNKKVLFLDNFDSYSYNLIDYLSMLGLEVLVFRNDCSLFELQNLKFDAIVLSPGPSRPKDAGVMLKCIAYYFDKVPILGICLGHQALGEFFGAKLVKTKPFHGKISLLDAVNDPIFENINFPIAVVRYHSLVLENLPTDLDIIAKTENDLIMAFKHHFLPIYGLQFHPEAALTETGFLMLVNWAKINQLIPNDFTFNHKNVVEKLFTTADL